MNEKAPASHSNEIIDLNGDMYDLAALHDIRGDEAFSDEFYSEGQTVVVSHDPEDRNHYSFRTPNRDYELHSFLSHKIFEVAIFSDDESNYAKLSVYKELNPLYRDRGNLQNDWIELQKTTGLSFPGDLDRKRFEQIVNDYFNHLAGQEE